MHALRRAIVTLGAMLATAAWAQMPASPAAEVRIGEPLRDVVMLGLNGPDRPLAAYRGRPLVINVWASWCGPCRQEMASLERLAWQERRTPFAVIGISTDDDRDNALRWLRASNATINHYIDRRLQLESMLGASRIPLTVLVDAQGRVLDKVYGAKEWDGPDGLAIIRKAFDAAPRSAAAR